MSDIPVIPAPTGLKPRSRKLWKEVTKAYELRLDDLIVLENACRTLDIVHDLDAAMVDQPLMVRGSMGQMRENPLLAEARQQRAQLNRSLAQLKLPEEGARAGVNQHRAAGLSRWAQEHGTAAS